MTAGSRKLDRGGFTLLEIMISIAILGFVILIVYGVFARTLSAKEYTEARAEEGATARAVLNRMARDLEAIVARSTNVLPQPTPTSDRTLPKAVQQILFLSHNVNEGGAPVDDLAFSAMVRRPAAVTLSSADLAVIHYFVESDPANANRRALFRETVFSLSGQVFDPEKPDPASTMRLLDGVAALEFRFFNGQDWVQEWDSGSPRDYGPAPLAVEISLAIWSDQGEPLVYRTAVDLPVVRALVPNAPPGVRPTPAPTQGGS